MPTHRVDMNLRGLSHYVDGELQGKPGFQVPEGLHRERDPRRRAGKEKKLVMREGLGMSVEWKSDGQARRAPRDPHRRDKIGDGADDEPGLFQVPDDGSSNEDRHYRAEDGHGRPWRRHASSDRAMKAMGCDPVESGGEWPPRWLEYQELMRWERDHGGASYQDHNRYPRGYGGSNRATNANSFDPYKSNVERSSRGLASHHDHDGYPRAYDGPSRTTREVTLDTSDNYKPHWLEELERKQRRRNHGSGRSQVFWY